MVLRTHAQGQCGLEFRKQWRQLRPRVHAGWLLWLTLVAAFGQGERPLASPESTTDRFRQPRRPAETSTNDRQTTPPRRESPVLTWSEDPQRTQTIQWGTSTLVRRGMVRFQKQGEVPVPGQAAVRCEPATTTKIVSWRTAHDPGIHWHKATLRDLEPDTTYVYSVGDGKPDGWSPTAEFTTAPAEPKSFSFVYLGDAQTGMRSWGNLVQAAIRRRPAAAFVVMAGDLVNSGNDRENWSRLLHSARGIFDRRPLVPALGNHECQGGRPALYLRLFDLPRNGPAEIEAERAYSFVYGQAQFVVLDSNLDPRTQVAWLDATLAGTAAQWKFVIFHHPVYSSAPHRDHPARREAWVPLFDRHRVDMVLQGHDHAYLRTFPLREGRRVDRPDQGTTYVVSVSGTKSYRQAARSYTECGFTGAPTYQVIDIDVAGRRLNYRAYDAEGHERDRLVIQK